MIADELLAQLRPVVGVGCLSYAEDPETLTGGYFTENRRFRLAGAPAPWAAPLVVRLFPTMVPDDLVLREAVVQAGVAAAGVPTPAVLHFDSASRIDGRRYFVMALAPGAPLMGGIGVGALLRDGPRLLGRLGGITADVQAQLHRVDPAPIVDQLDLASVTVDRWFARLQQLVDLGAIGFAPALEWLVEHRPSDTGAPVICHGDLHPGNLMIDADGRVTVLDWTVATLAPPVLDVAFTVMALSLAPIDAPRPVQRLVARFSRGIARRYVRAYLERNPVDLSAQRYYEALRCALEMGNAASWRLAVAAGRPEEQLRPTWDRIAGSMVRYFRVRTGVELVLPPPASA